SGHLAIPPLTEGRLWLAVARPICARVADARPLRKRSSFKAWGRCSWERHASCARGADVLRNRVARNVRRSPSTAPTAGRALVGNQLARPCHDRPQSVPQPACPPGAIHRSRRRWSSLLYMPCSQKGLPQKP
ncbi:unnamed protein product, partial [Ixodes persulcatus]